MPFNKINNFLFQTRNRPLVWDTLTTTGWSVLGKAIGFLVPFFIAAWFGVSAETDAFFFAYGLILFVSVIFAPAVESVVVPYIVETRTKGDDVGKFVGKILGFSGIGLLLLTGLLLLFIKPILSLITRFDTKTLNLVYHLLIEAAPLIILLTWTSVLAGALNTYKKFAISAISPAFRAVINLIIIFVFKDTLGVHAIALGYVVGEIVRLTILTIAIRQFNLFTLQLSFSFNSKLGEFLKTVSYQTIGLAAIGLNPIVDKTMASWLSRGGVSILYYADRLYMIPITFITTGLMVTLLSHWSGRYSRFEKHSLKKNVAKAAKITSFITVPIMMLLIFLHQPIVNVAFGRGVFAKSNLAEVGQVWVCYLLGFIPYTVGQIYVRGHLVLKNTKVLMKCAFYTVLLNMALNYILMKPFKIAGIALATTIISVYTLLYLSKSFYKKLKEA